MGPRVVLLIDLSGYQANPNANPNGPSVECSVLSVYQIDRSRLRRSLLGRPFAKLSDVSPRTHSQRQMQKQKHSQSQSLGQTQSRIHIKVKRRLGDGVGTINRNRNSGGVLELNVTSTSRRLDDDDGMRSVLVSYRLTVGLSALDINVEVQVSILTMINTVLAYVSMQFLFMSYEIHRETQLPFTSPSDARRRGRDAAVQGPYQENRIRIRSLECHFL